MLELLFLAFFNSFPDDMIPTFSSAWLFLVKNFFPTVGVILFLVAFGMRFLRLKPR